MATNAASGSLRQTGRESSGHSVIIVHPQVLIRQGMTRLLEEMDRFAVLADVTDASDGAREARRFDPDLVILDGDGQGGDLARDVEEIRTATPHARILVIAERADPARVERALSAGANGYTLKDISIDELVTTLTRIATHPDDVHLHPEAAAALVRNLEAFARGQRVPGQSPLTPRQQEIIELLSEGLANKQIARELGIGVHTVKTHISRILEKLDASSRTEAAVIAARQGLVTFD